MAAERHTSLETYQQADPETQAAYRANLQRMRNLDATPEAWTCSRCGVITLGEEILISYDVSEPPIPYCPTEGCPGRGEDPQAAEA